LSGDALINLRMHSTCHAPWRLGPVAPPTTNSFPASLIPSTRQHLPRSRPPRSHPINTWQAFFSLSSSGGEGWGEEAVLRDSIYEMGARLGNLGISPGLASTLEGVLKMPVARKRRPVSAPAILRNVAQASSPASSGGVSPPVSR